MHALSGVRLVAVVPAIALLGGSACGLLIARSPLATWGSRLPLSGVALTAAIVVALAVLAVVVWRLARPVVLAIVVGVVFFIGGAALSARAWHDATHLPLRAAFDAAAAGNFSIYATIDGVLSQDAAPSMAGVSLAIDAETIACDTCAGPPGADVSGAAPRARTAPSRPVRAAGGVLLTVVGSLAHEHLREWRAGRRVRVPATLRGPTPYRDPDVPDREEVMARQGTVLIGTVKSGALVELLARGPFWAEAAAALRQRVRDTVAHTVGHRSARSAAIVNAIVIGDRAGLDPDVQRSLQEAGTYHVIAISGGNIAILAGVLLFGFRSAGVLGRSAMLVAAVGLIAYAYLVGGGASVDRATLMAVVYFGTRAWDHRTAPLNSLGVVAALLVIASPLTIADPAFVLTFGATVAIIVVAPAAAARRIPRGLRAATSVLAASIAAEAALFPVAALVFSRVTVAGLALNFLAIPLMAIAQLAGMALVPVALMSDHAGQVVGWIAHIGAAGLVWSAQLVRIVPAVTWRIPPPHWAVVVLYYAAVVFACLTAGRWRALAAFGAAAACIWIVAAPWRLAAARGDGRLHVIFIDVGQGDATAIRFPRGAVWLVDAGGLSSSSFDVGDRVVAPVLRRMGTWRLDRLVLTHGDPDHVGGSQSILREFRPREVWEGVRAARYEPIALLADEARQMGLRWRAVRAGEEIVMDDVRVSVRHPPAPDWERLRVRNDDSVVLDVTWGDVSILLPGDIGLAIEPSIANDLAPAPFRVVKAPHHGSAGSSGDALVNGARPAVAVFSVGRGNRFGHPAPAVVARYQAAGAEIFRTDLDGAIFLDTDGRSVTIRTFTGRKVLAPDAGREHTTLTKTTKDTNPD